jgi:hypothetical protein
MHPHNTNRDAFHTQRQQQNDKKEDEEGVKKRRRRETRARALLFAAAAAEGRWYKQRFDAHTHRACVARPPKWAKRKMLDWVRFWVPWLVYHRYAYVSEQKERKQKLGEKKQDDEAGL